MSSRSDYPRGLSEDEQAAWARLAATVEPLNPPRSGEGDRAQRGGGDSPSGSPPPVRNTSAPPLRQPQPRRRLPPPRAGEGGGLDSHWDRRLKKGEIAPDFTLDLHGHSLDAAYQRLMRGMAQAKAMQARLVLVVTGKPRPVDAADRAERRGAIRAKILDWLAASDHGSDIAAIRGAQRKHGGAGAIYIVLRK